MMVRDGPLPLIALPGVLELVLSMTKDAVRVLAILACKTLFSLCDSERALDNSVARAWALETSTSLATSCF